MTPENDKILTRLTVRLEDATSAEPIGTGTILCPKIDDKYAYIVTAAHCLFYDSDRFQKQRLQVGVAVFNPLNSTYEKVDVEVLYKLTGAAQQKDIAVLVIERSQIEAIAGSLPLVRVIKERNSITSFVLKGFPSAAKGREVVTTRPTFNQDLLDQKKFNLLLTDDFTTSTNAEPKVDGFSGSGIFIESSNQLYLLGIFTRFRDAQKIIYCEYIEPLNQILNAQFLPLISFSYLGEYGLTTEFFKRHNMLAIKNLGPRFSEKLNIKLPIASLFNVIAKDDRFKNSITRPIDKWLTQRNRGQYPEVEDIDKMLVEIKTDFIKWLKDLRWDAESILDVESFLSRINLLNETINNKTTELYKLQDEKGREERDKPKVKNKASQPKPFENELHELRQILDANSELLLTLNGSSITLSNSPVLIIKGDPGCGKSHLLGDIASEAIKAGAANILLLGQLFRAGKTIWQNIADQMNLTCHRDELLLALNNIGRQQGERVLIMVDALNEGAGKEMWKDELSGFIELVLRFPHIGLILTVRSTYFSSIVPKSLHNDPRVTIWEHDGFKGNEYAALRLFCEHYGLITPSFPILAPEFANPLFLQLICQGVMGSGQQSFPQGFQGVTNIFNYYTNALYEKLVEKREIYLNRKKMIQDAIFLFAEACFEKDGPRMLSITEADKLFHGKFPRLPHIMNDLIHENVLIQNSIRDDLEGDKEVLSFAYERFGDFFIAERLIESLKDSSEVMLAFAENNRLGNLMNQYWRNDGLLEAMAVLLPEKFGLEIVEVYDWVMENEKSYGLDKWLGEFLWGSLKWRESSSINDEKIIDWLQKYPNAVSEERWLMGLTELTSVHNHPFNGDRLFANLIRYPMAQRDGFWQNHMRYYSDTDDSFNAYPLKRLLDWAWKPNISIEADSESVRLTGQTLVWLLSSTNRKLRDQSTKALVNLLEQQPETLIKILSKYRDIDDPYISERLYAVAYGCTLRASSLEGIKLIAEYVFNTVFASGRPPVHVLLRDYSRNIVEYANSLGLIDTIDINLVRPPYTSKFPRTLPNVEDIEHFDTNIADDDPEHVKAKKRIKGRIHFSIMHWDFGRYTIDSALSGFNAISFTTEKEFTVFKKNMSSGQKTKITIVERIIECAALLKSKKAQGVENIGYKPVDEEINLTESQLDDFLNLLEDDLEPDAFLDFREIYVPHLKAKYDNPDKFSEPENRSGIKRWIVARAYDLGYDYELHGDYDQSIERYSAWSENDSERIGKKYQWIALHEMVAMLGDNFYFTSDRWSSSLKKSFYQGPWQHYLRDIDPAYTTKNLVDYDSYEVKDIENNLGWWFNTPYSYWNQAKSIWAENKSDLPAPQQIIRKKDDQGMEWLYLKLNCGWKEPKQLGQESYGTFRKEIFYMINAYIIRKEDKAKLLKWMRSQNFFGRWMPESRSSPTGLCNRENYWSPASVWNSKEYKVWESVKGSTSKVIVAVHEAVGEMSEDKSEAHSKFYMPCKTLFEEMKLQYAAEDGTFKNAQGEIIARNTTPTGIQIRRKELEEFLDKMELDIVWTLLGEKNMFHGMGGSENLFRAINGVYYLDRGNLVGDLSITKRDGKNAG